MCCYMLLNFDALHMGLYSFCIVFCYDLMWVLVDSLRELPSPARLSRSIARERHREGSPYARLTPPRARSRRASLAIISATGGLLTAVPCVLFSFLHIFPIQNGHFFQKSPNLALKRNAKRPLWPQTCMFPKKKQQC